MKLCFHLIAVSVSLLGCAANAQVTPREVPQKTTVCELLADPAKWNHKLVEVSGTASHGFEDSGFFGKDCNNTHAWLWMAYGGKRTTQTISTANENQPSRPKEMEVEGIKIPLVEDGKLDDFDKRLHPAGKHRHSTKVQATVVARFFAGDLQHLPAGDLWGGYGHLGCCSLFVVQQVVSVGGTGAR